MHPIIQPIQASLVNRQNRHRLARQSAQDHRLKRTWLLMFASLPMLCVAARGQAASPPVDLVAATNRILTNSAQVPGWVPVYEDIEPIKDAYFTTSCEQFNPINIKPVQQPPIGVIIPYVPPTKITVDGTVFNLSWPWCNAVQHVPNRRVGGIPPQVSSVQIIRATPVVYAAPVLTDLPSGAVVQGQTFINCSSTPTTQMTTLSVALARMVSTTMTNTVSDGGTFGISLADKVSDALTITGSLSFTSSDTRATAALQGTTTTITKTDQVSVTVPAKTALTATIEIHPIVYKQTFSTTVLVDGTFKPYTCSLPKCPKNIDDLYEVPASPGGKRFTPDLVTFPVRGFLTTTDSSDATTATYNSTLPADCTNGLTGMRVVAMRPRK